MTAVAVKETIWKELDDEPIHKALKEEYSVFEDLFAAKETVKAKTDSNVDNLDTAVKEITFLDSKRSQNSNIMLKAIKLSPKVIKDAVEECDTETLPRHILTELMKFIPTDDELLTLKGYENDVERLASAERFLYELSTVSKYGEKLKALLFKTSFEEQLDDFERLIGQLSRASSDVKNTKQFKEILKIILALGNYMNAGQRGGAYGFKLGSLLKMIDTKSSVSGRKHTLLHYLTELLEKKFPDLQNFDKELSNVEDGAKVTIPSIRQALVAMRDGLRDMENLLKELAAGHEKALESAAKKEKAKKTGPAATALPEKNSFVEAMGTFYAESHAIYEKNNADFKKAEQDYELVVTLYGEDPKTMFPEEFFGIFWKFSSGFVNARTENSEAIAKEKENEKREVEKKNREEKRRRKNDANDSAAKDGTASGLLSRTKTPSFGAKAEQAGEGGLDDLISSIRTGKAFGGDNTRRRDRSNQKDSVAAANNPKVKSGAKANAASKNDKVSGKSNDDILASLKSGPAQGGTKIARRLSIARGDKERPFTPDSASSSVKGVSNDSPSSTTRGRRLSRNQNSSFTSDHAEESEAFTDRRSRRISVGEKERPHSQILSASAKGSVLSDIGKQSTRSRKASVSDKDRPSLSKPPTGEISSDRSAAPRIKRLSVIERERSLLGETMNRSFTEDVSE